MPKHDKPILDVSAVRETRETRETRFHDYCLLEGYRNPAKGRLTQTADHYIEAKRPFELAVLRSAIPSSEWNTLDDTSQTLNKAIRRTKYIIPTLEENLHKLHGMKYMTVIDVKEAFQNIPLTLRSSLMTTMYTPWGRYRWTRLPFGISSASEAWQRRIHTVLEGFQVISIADDILIPGCGTTDAEARIDHNRNLIAVLVRFELHHVK